MSRCVFIAQSCLTLCNPMDHSPPGSSVHGILQATILEWVAISFSRGCSTPRDQTCISYIGWQITTEPWVKPHTVVRGPFFPICLLSFSSFLFTIKGKLVTALKSVASNSYTSILDHHQCVTLLLPCLKPVFSIENHAHTPPTHSKGFHNGNKTIW